MPAPPPTEPELMALAEHALTFVPEGQATAWWSWAPRTPPAVQVELLSGTGTARTDRLDDDGLRAAAREAAARSEGSGPPLPAPAPGRAHQGYDPGLLRAQPPPARAGLAKVAIASSRGVRAFEQRSFAVAEAGGLRAAAPSPEAIDVAALGAEAAALAHGDEAAVPPPDGELPLVLGPDAVAAVLERLRADLSRAGALPAGTRVAAPNVSLSDSPRFAGTLPRSYDAYGTPRQPVPLIQDGVAHRTVSPATGHAVRAGSDEARPEHLVLVGGGAAGIEELLAPVALGLYLPTLERPFLIRDGRRAEPLAVASWAIDPLAVLAATQALTARQRAIPTEGDARTVGATVCPALRTARGISPLP